MGSFSWAAQEEVVRILLPQGQLNCSLDSMGISSKSHGGGETCRVIPPPTQCHTHLLKVHLGREILVLLLGGLHWRKEASVEIQKEKKNHTKILSPVPKINLFRSHPLGITTQQRVRYTQGRAGGSCVSSADGILEIAKLGFPRASPLRDGSSGESLQEGLAVLLQHRPLPPTASGSLSAFQSSRALIFPPGLVQTEEWLFFFFYCLCSNFLDFFFLTGFSIFRFCFSKTHTLGSYQPPWKTLYCSLFPFLSRECCLYSSWSNPKHLLSMKLSKWSTGSH